MFLAKLQKNHLSNHFGSEMTKVILFGSRAKNMEHLDSDYDILIILKTNQNSFKFFHN